LLGNIGETACIGTFIYPNKSPQREEAFIVNDAASPVGCFVSQMAKFAGSKVIGNKRGQKEIGFLERHLKLHGISSFMV
jgi:NADPH-dependent curcumin reductase CurA